MSVVTTVKPGQLEQPDFSEQTIDSADQGQVPALSFCFRN